MRPPSAFLLAAAALAALAGIAASDGPGHPPTRASADEKYVREVLTATDPSDAAAGYRKLFRRAPADDLRRLKEHDSATVAIQAAWEEVERTVPDGPPRTVRPDRGQLGRFVGFLEHRTRLRAPDWWADAILDARANRRGNIYAGGITMLERRDQPYALEPPARAKLESKGGKTFVRVGAEAAEVPDAVRDKLGDHFEQYAAHITPERCYIAAHESVGYAYRLACVDRSARKVLWVATVWASWWGAASGVHHQWVEVTAQHGIVAVFGVAGTGFHTEAFRAADGKNLLRFSNSYTPW